MSMIRTLFHRIQAIRDSRNLAFEVLALQLAFTVLVLFNIPVITQIFGFLYLLFVPGFVVLRLLKLDNLNRLDMILFSAGFSIAFLMFGGLATNEIATMLGISRPLTKIPLLLMLNSLTFLFCFTSDPSGDDRFKFRFVEGLKSIAPALLIVPFILLPFLTVLGVIWMNTYQNNVIFLFMIIAVSVLFVAGVLAKSLLPPRFYPIAVLAIAISLLLHVSLMGKYLLSGGTDIVNEYYVFKFTEINAQWYLLPQQALMNVVAARYNDMLSITILPAIFTSLTSIDAVWMLKILYPLIFSLVPLILYSLWRARVGSKAAFVSTFVLMAQSTFYMLMWGVARQEIGELFFSLSVLVVLKADMTTFKRISCFTIFGGALIVSHYSMALIFLFFIFLAWVLLTLTRRWTTRITLPMILIFFVLMFSWYIYTSNSNTFQTILQFGDYVYGQLGQFASLTSRGSTVMRGMGIETASGYNLTIWNWIGRAFAYLVQFLIVVGLIGLVTKRLKASIDREFLIFSILSTVLLVSLVVVPGLANTLNMERFFHILLFFLAPLCILGAEFLVKLVFRRKAELMTTLLLVIILIPYFLFQTNLVYEVTGSDSWSVPLSMYRWEKTDPVRLYSKEGYIDEQSAFGAQWLLEKVEINQTQIYADVPAEGWVLRYFGIVGSADAPIETLSNCTQVTTNGTIYLSRLNVVKGKIVGIPILNRTSGERSVPEWNITEFSSVFDDLNKIYSNGASEIYKNTLAP